jgi:hypothetical protein
MQQEDAEDDTMMTGRVASIGRTRRGSGRFLKILVCVAFLLYRPLKGRQEGSFRGEEHGYHVSLGRVQLGDLPAP